MRKEAAEQKSADHASIGQTGIIILLGKKLCCHGAQGPFLSFQDAGPVAIWRTTNVLGARFMYGPENLEMDALISDLARLQISCSDFAAFPSPATPSVILLTSCSNRAVLFC